jgi:PaaX protein central Cas2-like domain
MARQGWLLPVRLPAGAGYRLTPRAVGRVRQAADRIYRQDAPPWDGRWHVVVVERVGDRAGRERLRSALGYLGYACVDGSTWISPRPSEELDALLAAEQISAERFHASYDGDDRILAARAWDIDGLASGYRQWLEGPASLSGQQPAIGQTRRCSRSGASWCTSGASSSLSILGCLASCCLRAGQARMPPSCSVPMQAASCCCLAGGALTGPVSGPHPGRRSRPGLERGLRSAPRAHR